MSEQTAILTAASASTDYERHAAIEATRYNPFAQMIGQSWRAARILVRVDNDQDFESVVSGIKAHVERASGIRYRRDA